MKHIIVLIPRSGYRDAISEEGICIKYYFPSYSCFDSMCLVISSSVKLHFSSAKKKLYIFEVKFILLRKSNFLFFFSSFSYTKKIKAIFMLKLPVDVYKCVFIKGMEEKKKFLFLIFYRLSCFFHRSQYIRWCVLYPPGCQYTSNSTKVWSVHVLVSEWPCF